MKSYISKIGVLLLLVFVITGCASANKGLNDDPIIGELFMKPSGELKVKVFDSLSLPDGYLVKQSSPSYNILISQAGGIKSGQTKPLYRYLGSVTLQGDQAIKLEFASQEPDITLWPLIEIIGPEDPRYVKLMPHLQDSNEIAITEISEVFAILYPEE